MEMREWVERLMGLGPEWRIERVDEDSERQDARVALAREAGSALRCPECGRACPGCGGSGGGWTHGDTRRSWCTTCLGWNVPSTGW